jgi:preprotein translocase subunit SecF
MEFFKKKTEINFLGSRKIPAAVSVLLLVATVFILATRGLNFGLDFTGGTLIEIVYDKPVEIATVRKGLSDEGYKDAVVQHFGTIQDVLVRLPVRENEKSITLSNNILALLRKQAGEVSTESEGKKVQQCQSLENSVTGPCKIQVRRVEFVGPQVGGELAEKGGLALIYTLIAVLAYVMFRFEWRFALGAVIAVAHDVLLTFGFFSVTQIEFDLTVLAALLAVLGYSLNDTIVVFDRIRENFHKIRRSAVADILNQSINDTLSRTIITSGTTMLALVSLFVFGGEIIRGFSAALIVGVVVGTYSSIYIATPAVLALGITREDMLAPEKEGAADSTP